MVLLVIAVKEIIEDMVSAAESLSPLLPPPLPHHQLIIAVAGVLTGYNGSFEFEEPGQQYKDTPYVGMRVVRAYTLCTALD